MLFLVVSSAVSVFFVTNDVFFKFKLYCFSVSWRLDHIVETVISGRFIVEATVTVKVVFFRRFLIVTQLPHRNELHLPGQSKPQNSAHAVPAQKSLIWKTFAKLKGRRVALDVRSFTLTCEVRSLLPLTSLSSAFSSIQRAEVKVQRFPVPPVRKPQSPAGGFLLFQEPCGDKVPFEPKMIAYICLYT